MSNLLTDDEKKLVIARLQIMPENIGIVVGSDGNYSIEEMIQLVEDEDEVGVQYAEMQLEFLRALKENALYA